MKSSDKNGPWTSIAGNHCHKSWDRTLMIYNDIYIYYVYIYIYIYVQSVLTRWIFGASFHWQYDDKPGQKRAKTTADPGGIGMVRWSSWSHPLIEMLCFQELTVTQPGY